MSDEELDGSREWQENLALLKEAHDEPVAPAHYAAVRARVMSELVRRERPVWARGWVWGLAAAMAAAVLAGMWVDVRPRVEPPSVALVYPAAPAVEKRPVATKAGAVRRPRAEVQRAKVEGLLIKIETDNPDVVVYWIADRKGDE